MKTTKTPTSSRWIALAGALITLILAAPVGATTLPAGFQERTVADGFVWPTNVDWTPDGRMLVVQKSGQLKVVNPGQTTGTTALDLSSKVNDYGDRGLIGLAVDSSYATNHYVYLAYTYDVNQLAPDGDGPMVSQIMRIQLSTTNVVSDQRVIMGSYTSGPCPTPSNTLDCIPSDDTSHSIGTIRSAPDGTLYIGSGDGASFNYADQLALRTYDETTYAGKIMHVDRNGNGLAGHSFCPSDTTLTHVCAKLYAKGLRNPFRFSLRPDGRTLVVGDVGWASKEETDVISSGGHNYGWPCYEADTRTPGYRDFDGCAAQYANEGTANAALAPAYSYDHEAKWSAYTSGAIIGGPTYSGSSYPAAYSDSVFFGDYALGYLSYAKVAANGAVSGVQRISEDWFGVDLEDAPDGNLTWSMIDDFDTGAGHIGKVVYTGGSNHQPVARATADKTSGATPLTVAFTGGASTDPDGDTLTYSWDFGDGGHSTAANPSHTYTATGTFAAKLTVSDGTGATDSKTVSIAAGNTAPVPTITSPASTLKYADGDTISLSGKATDAEDGNLAGSALSWNVILEHGDHTHPITSIAGTANTTFKVRDDHDADSYYRITLTATDSGGRSTSVTTKISPRTHTMHLDSQPSGADIGYSGYTRTTPWVGNAAIGYKADISAPATFVKDGTTYNFDHWSDGGARLHTITTPDSDSTYTAVYTATPAPTTPAGLIAAYNFDETSGTTAADATGNGHAGTVSGAAWTTGGKHDGALNFDGVNDWVTVADSNDLDFSSSFTLEGWVRPDTLKPYQPIAMKETTGNYAYGLYATDSGNPGKPNGGIGDDGVWSGTPLVQSQWSHVAVTFSGGTLKLYVNGALIDSAPAPNAPASTGALRIGGDSVWSGEFFDGLIDDLRLYNRALSAGEITTDMNTAVTTSVPPTTPPPTTPPPTTPPSSTSLVAEYDFDATSGTTATDASGNAHTGTLSGGAGWSAGGKHGGALSLDGVDDMVTVPDSDALDLTTAMTLEAWVKPSTLKAWQAVVFKEAPGDAAYSLYGTGGGSAQPNGWIGPRGVYSPSAMKAGAWSHLALTYDGSRSRIYVDGVLKATGTNVPKPPSTSGVLRIGGDGVWSGEQFNGLIDEVRIYKKALSASEITTDMGSAVAKASSKHRVTAPRIAKACIWPGTTNKPTKLSSAQRKKKLKLCADKPHKTRKK